jgi:hypothetical protein
MNRKPVAEFEPRSREVPGPNKEEPGPNKSVGFSRLPVCHQLQLVGSIPLAPCRAGFSQLASRTSESREGPAGHPPPGSGFPRPLLPSLRRASRSLHEFPLTPSAPLGNLPAWFGTDNLNTLKTAGKILCPRVL